MVTISKHFSLLPKKAGVFPDLFIWVQHEVLMNINKPPVLWFTNLEPYSISLPKSRKILSIEHYKTELGCDTIVNK